MNEALLEKRTHVISCESRVECLTFKNRGFGGWFNEHLVCVDEDRLEMKVPTFQTVPDPLQVVICRYKTDRNVVTFI